MEKSVKSFRINWLELAFLAFIYFLGLFWRLWPRLSIDPHLLTMNADVWERLAMAQYFLDHGHLPIYDLRYIAYGNVPFWYPPLGPIFLGILAKISAFDLPTVCSRIMPFFEALTPLPLYFLARWLFGRYVGFISAAILTLTPSFLYWTGITTPTSLTLFLLPIYIILLLMREEGGELSIRQRLLWIGITATLLSFNFLIHLTYFFAVAILIPMALVIFTKRPFGGRKILDFSAALALSQLLTIFWWLPHNLYQWWIFRLCTSSSGSQAALAQLEDYGLTPGILGAVACIIYLWSILKKTRSRIRYNWLPLIWLILPLWETQSETILRLIKRLDLAWYTIIKPLEGFRFYGFLAQPLALIIGWVTVKYLITRLKRPGLACFTVVLIISGIITADLYYNYRIVIRLQNPGINVTEYRAAVWFRNHTSEKDRIIADYYRSQMLAGVCGGKALLGGLFPLRNVKLPYVTVPAIVQDDICTIYTTPDPEMARNLMLKYGCDCLFISPNLLSAGNIGSTQCQGFGIKVELKKFENPQYFTEFYNDGQGTRIIKISGGLANK
jgi:hypothetical protein